MDLATARTIEQSCRTPYTNDHHHTPADVLHALTWLIGELDRVTAAADAMRTDLERINQMYPSCGYRLQDARALAAVHISPESPVTFQKTHSPEPIQPG